MNLTQSIIGTVLALTLTNVGYSQNRPEFSEISLSIGVNNVSNKDRFQSSYTYSGKNLLLNGGYTRVKARGQHTISMTYTDGHIKSIVSPQADNKLFRLNYDYLRTLKTGHVNDKFSISLGIGLQVLMNNINYLPKVRLPKSYWSGGAFLTFNGEVLYHITKKSRLRLRLGLPVFGTVYRPDFEINGKTLTKTTRIGQTNLFTAKAVYDYKLSSKLYLTATYNYNYFTFDEPRRITILQNALLVGLKHRF